MFGPDRSFKNVKLWTVAKGISVKDGRDSVKGAETNIGKKWGEYNLCRKEGI